MNFTIPGMNSFGGIMSKINNFIAKASNIDNITVVGYIVVFLCIALIFISIRNRMRGE